MKGKIEIATDGIDHVSVLVKTTKLHSVEKLILVESLVEALKLTEEERMVIGLAVATGSVKAEKIEIDLSSIRKKEGSQDV